MAVDPADLIATIAALLEQNAKLRAEKAFLIGAFTLLMLSFTAVLWMLRMLR